MYTMEFVSPATAAPFTQITLYFVFTLSTCRRIMAHSHSQEKISTAVKKTYFNSMTKKQK